MCANHAEIGYCGAKLQQSTRMCDLVDRHWRRRSGHTLARTFDHGAAGHWGIFGPRESATDSSVKNRTTGIWIFPVEYPWRGKIQVGSIGIGAREYKVFVRPFLNRRALQSRRFRRNTKYLVV